MTNLDIEEIKAIAAMIMSYEIKDDLKDVISKLKGSNVEEVSSNKVTICQNLNSIYDTPFDELEVKMLLKKLIMMLEQS